LLVKEGKTVLYNRDNKQKYLTEKVLGEGTFGKVYRCIDLESEKKLAVKVIKSEDRYVDSAQLETKVLVKLKEEDPKGDYNVIHLHDEFMYRGHPCLVFDILGKSTYDYQKDNDFRAFKFEHVKIMTFQLIRAVKFLHDMKLTHTDLKPENILFRCDDYDEVSSRSGKIIKVIRDPTIVLIDFGSATFEHEKKTRIVATRHYRPPEVILELGWSHPCDVWSVGCIIFEWYMGICMFQTHDNREHLAMMERIIGLFPNRMVKESKKGKRYFYKKSETLTNEITGGYRVDWDWESKDGKYVRENCKPLDRYNQSRTNSEHIALFDLIKQMIDYEPRRRITLAESIKHKFVSRQYETYLDNQRRNLLKEKESLIEKVNRSRSNTRKTRRSSTRSTSRYRRRSSSTPPRIRRRRSRSRRARSRRRRSSDHRRHRRTRSRSRRRSRSASRSRSRSNRYRRRHRSSESYRRRN